MEFIKKYRPDIQELLLEDQNSSVKGLNTFRNLVFKNYLEDRVSNIAEVNFKIEPVSQIVTHINNLLFSTFKNTILNDIFFCIFWVNF